MSDLRISLLAHRGSVWVWDGVRAPVMGGRDRGRGSAFDFPSLVFSIEAISCAWAESLCTDSEGSVPLSLCALTAAAASVSSVMIPREIKGTAGGGIVAIMGDVGGVTFTVGLGDFSFDVTGTGFGRDETFTADTAVRRAGTFFRAVPGPMVAAVMGRGGTGESRAAPVR